MQQNLSDKERKIRLVIGITFALATVASVLDSRSIYITVSLGLLSLGFTANYFTCFCGTKRLLKKLKE